MASTVFEIAQIRERLNQIEPDGAAKRVADRLLCDSRAIEALAELASTEGILERIIGSLIEADKIGRTLGKRLEKEKSIRRSIGKLGQAVTDLTKFVREISAEEPDPLNAFIHVQPEDKRRYTQALYEIELLLKARERIAVETPLRLGATRKRNIRNASLNAGISWLGASIKKITGRPHTRQACALSEALFGIPEVSEDRLRGAVRNITDRNWRAP